MQMVALVAFQYLEFQDLPATGVDLEPYITISTDAELKTAIMVNRMAPAVGSLDLQDILRARAFAHAIRRYPDPRIEPPQALSFCRSFTANAKLLLLALWLIKDNCGNCSPGYFYFANNGDSGFHAIQRHDAMYLSAACTLEPASFALPDLQRAVEYYHQFKVVLPMQVPDPTKVSVTGIIEESRIARTLYLIQAARNSGDVGVKIAFYCICFESLFSTDTSGVSHRVAERAAIFVEESGMER